MISMDRTAPEPRVRSNTHPHFHPCSLATARAQHMGTPLSSHVTAHALCTESSITTTSSVSCVASGAHLRHPTLPQLRSRLACGSFKTGLVTSRDRRVAPLSRVSTLTSRTLGAASSTAICTHALTTIRACTRSHTALVCLGLRHTGPSVIGRRRPISSGGGGRRRDGRDPSAPQYGRRLEGLGLGGLAVDRWRPRRLSGPVPLPVPPTTLP